MGGWLGWSFFCFTLWLLRLFALFIGMFGLCALFDVRLLGLHGLRKNCSCCCVCFFGYFFEMLDDVSCFSCYLYSILPNISLLMLLPLFLTAASAAISNACVASWYHEAKSYTWLSCGYMNVNATEYFFSHVDGVFVSKLNCTLSSNLKSREVASHVRPTKDACEWIGILSDAANMVNEDEQFGLNFCTWGTRCAKTLSRKFWKILPCVAIYANFLFLFYCSTALRLKILKTPNCLLRLKKMNKPNCLLNEEPVLRYIGLLYMLAGWSMRNLFNRVLYARHCKYSRSSPVKTTEQKLQLKASSYVSFYFVYE